MHQLEREYRFCSRRHNPRTELESDRFVNPRALSVFFDPHRPRTHPRVYVCDAVNKTSVGMVGNGTKTMNHLSINLEQAMTAQRRC